MLRKRTIKRKGQKSQLAPVLGPGFIGRIREQKLVEAVARHELDKLDLSEEEFNEMKKFVWKHGLRIRQEGFLSVIDVPNISLKCYGKLFESRPFRKNPRAQKEYEVQSYVHEELGITPEPLFLHPSYVAIDLLRDKPLSQCLEDMSEAKRDAFLESVVENIALLYSMKPNGIEKWLRDDYFTERDGSIRIGNNYLSNAKNELGSFTEYLNQKSNGIIHNDLHWDNVFVTEQEQAQFIDWECSRYGMPQSDLFRILVSYNYQRIPAKEERFVNLLAQGLKADPEEFYFDYQRCKVYGGLRMARGCSRLNSDNFKGKNSRLREAEIIALESASAALDTLREHQEYPKINKTIRKKLRRLRKCNPR